MVVVLRAGGVVCTPMRETELAKLTSSTGSEAVDLEEPPPGFEAALEARLNALEAPSSFHQATLYYALAADAPSGRLKGALLAGSRGSCCCRRSSRAA